MRTVITLMLWFFVFGEVYADARNLQVVKDSEAAQYVGKKGGGSSYGPTRNSNLKQHPNLVEWDILVPEEERDFIREIPAILQSAGLAVNR